MKKPARSKEQGAGSLEQKNRGLRIAKISLLLLFFYSPFPFRHSPSALAADCVDNALLKTTTCALSDAEWNAYRIAQKHHGATILADMIAAYLKDRRTAVPDQLIEEVKREGWDALTTEQQNWVKQRLGMP